MSGKKKLFEGFSRGSAGVGFTPIPNAFFSSLLPLIQDLTELRATLYVFWALYRRKGHPKFITLDQMLGDRSLVASIKGEHLPADELQKGLKSAVTRGTLLYIKIENDSGEQELYFINDDQSREALALIESGQLELEGIVVTEPAPAEEIPNIFSLYEQHVGLLTPLVADELKEAEDTYPPAWIEEAFREAAQLNKRSWRYISRILERWQAEGKDDGRTGTTSQKDLSPKEYYRKYSRLT